MSEKLRKHIINYERRKFDEAYCLRKIKTLDLMEEGILQGTGNFITVENEDGEKIEMEEPEEIHTYQRWKSLNRQVKRGEKSIATIQIWKHTVKKPKEKDEQEQERMFLTNAFFFTEAQTEVIA